MSILNPSAPSPVFAAIDLGTNNCRMVVARPAYSGFRIVDAYSRITRLGEGIAASGILSAVAMRRTIEALKHCALRMAKNGVTHSRLVTTEACRRASNHREFAQQVSEETGLFLEIISAEEEAALALTGCAPLLEPARALVFDIGGGSTEVMWVDNRHGRRRIEGVISIPFGVVTASERFGPDLNDPDGYAAAVEFFAGSFASFDAHHGIADRLGQEKVQMLGTSGTVTTLAALHLGLERYDRNAVDGLDMAFADVSRVSESLFGMTNAERANLSCVGTERAELVVAGCAILTGMMRLWPLGRLRVADRGVREGVLLGLIADNRRTKSRKRADPVST